MASRTRDFIERSATWIGETFRLNSDSRVCDFGCGPGLYTSRFARYGAQVTGVDFSEHSLEYARRQAEAASQTIRYVRQNYLEFDTTERFDLITLIMCDFCALSPAQRTTLLGRFSDLLAEDGAVLLDVYTLAAFAKREESASYAFRQLDGFWSAEEYYGFLNTFKYEAEKVVLDKYSLYEKARERVVYNWLQYYDWRALRAELEAAGFIVEAWYADVAGTPYRPDDEEMAVVLRKHR
jgi:SAM-dependent methyltransferase